MTGIWNWVTAIMGVCMALLPLLHVRKMYKDKSSKGQSALAVALGIASSAIWLIYGILNGLITVKVTSSTFLVVEIIWLVVVLKYRGTE